MLKRLLVALVCLSFACQLIAQESKIITLVTNGAEMSYRKGSSEPPADWNARDFQQDASWLAGKVPVGYGESVINAATFTIFEDMRNNYASVYMRIPFEITDPSRITELRCQSFQYDDGFIAYVNGVEIARLGFAANAEVTSQTLPTSHEYTDPPFNKVINDAEVLDSLRAGTNILAVQIHNTTVGSSDLFFRGLFRATEIEKPDPIFIRGPQCDGSDALDLGDPIYLLRWKFGGSYPEPSCLKACDMNDDGDIDQSDAIYALQYLFVGGAPFPAPYPEEGTDPTVDELSCVSGEPEL